MSLSALYPGRLCDKAGCIQTNSKSALMKDANGPWREAHNFSVKLVHFINIKGQETIWKELH